MAETHWGRAPETSMRRVAGTLNHSLPSVHTPAISVAPMPVENAPNAPCVVVWESVPTTTMPGST